MAKVFTLFSTLLTTHPHDRRVIHIAGKNNTGKSVLVKDFIIHDLTHSERNYFFIDTENKFALRNFTSALPKHLQARIFQKTLSATHSLSKILDILINPDFPIQAGDVVVIDSLSEVLKHSIVKTEDWYEYRYELKEFTNTLMAKLIKLLVRKDLSCIFTHHVTYHPTYDALIPYYFDLVNLIPGMWAFLEETPAGIEDGRLYFNKTLILSLTVNNPMKKALIQVQSFREKFPYEISGGHFTFLNPITPSL